MVFAAAGTVNSSVTALDGAPAYKASELVPAGLPPPSSLAVPKAATSVQVVPS